LAHAIALEVVTPSLSQGTAAKTTSKSCQKCFPAKHSGTSLTVRSRGRRIFRSASDIPSAAPLNSGVSLLYFLFGTERPHGCFLWPWTDISDIGTAHAGAIFFLAPFFSF
jgi:hypothetical protein